MIKNKHKSGINISSRDKIMINSPEVHFNITRQYPEVGCWTADYSKFLN
jgi:hypothetical protein